MAAAAKPADMLLKNRPAVIDAAPTTPAKGFEHLPASALAVLRWLRASGVDHVLVGPVARATRGASAVTGPVAIVPAPYGRNLDRLARALNAVKAKERSHHRLVNSALAAREVAPRFKPEMLVRPERWTLRCGEYELDIEGRPVGSSSYQELLYDAVRLELAPELSVEVAAPEDVEGYDQVRRSGSVPAMVVTRL